MHGLKNVRHRHDDALSRKDWAAVESLLAVYYRGQGWQVEHCGTAASAQRFDGGIDLKLRHDDQYVLVQCKHWNAKQVPHNEVHQLLGVMVNEGATGAILVSSGEFTQAAVDAAQKLGHVQLIDGVELRQMIGPLPEPVVSTATPTPEFNFRPSSRTQAATKRKPINGWLLVTAVGLIAFVFIIQALLKRTAGTAGPAKENIAAYTPNDSAMADKAELATHAQSDPVIESTRDACHEMIDSPSGTYIDHCANSSPPPQPTQAEIVESQRRAAEAMKIIEDHTPEM